MSAESGIKNEKKRSQNRKIQRTAVQFVKKTARKRRLFAFEIGLQISRREGDLRFVRDSFDKISF